jgi:hypothetical protein
MEKKDEMIKRSDGKKKKKNKKGNNNDQYKGKETQPQMAP